LLGLGYHETAHLTIFYPTIVQIMDSRINIIFASIAIMFSISFLPGRGGSYRPKVENKTN